ncbi:MAG: hypothetical protein HZC17_07955 [Candidatus Omnitrophica bacterium]|nr:hypothetical protein [Candidatus Omnitrophota bacterium]
MTPAVQYQIAAFVTFLVNLFLVIFISVKGKGRPLVRRFISYCSAIILWSLSVFLTTTSTRYELAYFFNQLTHVGAVLIPVFFLHFVYDYLGISGRKILLNFFYGIAGCFLAVIVFKRDWFFGGLSSKLTLTYFPDPGFLYTPWMATFFLAVFFGHIYLFRAWLNAQNKVQKKQIGFFFLANLLGYMGGVGCFLPVYGLSFFPFPYGSYGVALFSIVTAYTVLRHRWLDIEVILRKTVVFAGLFAVVFAVIFFFGIIFQNLISNYIGLPPGIATAMAVIIAVLIYEPVRRILVNWTDRFLFQKKFKLSMIVTQASHAIALIQSLKWLAKRIIAFLIVKCRIQNAAAYVWHEEDQYFELSALRGYAIREYPPAIFSLDHPIIRYLKEVKRPIEREEFENPVSGEKRLAAFKNDRGSILEFFETSKAQVIVPSFLRRRFGWLSSEDETQKDSDELMLRSILILGAMKSDEPYTDEDIEVFFGLAQESVIAIENARLYDEILHRSKELAEANKQLLNTNEKLRVTQASLIVAEKNATMVGMAKAIGHEINNPLATVSGRAMMIGNNEHLLESLIRKYKQHISEDDLGKSDQLIAKNADNIQRIERSAQRINVVVQTLTNILKDTKGGLSQLSLIVLCREAIEAARFSTFEESFWGNKIQERIGANIIIMGNLEQLIQVFVNLIKNAHEATVYQKDAQIIIDGCIDPDDPKMARINFVDNGPGIPREIITKIWHQGFSTKQKKDDSIGASGQGQGLFVCKHIIESIHKGAIGVESDEGKGTTFVIKLPLAEESENGNGQFIGS